MNLRGKDRLRMLLMGAVAVGVFGTQPLTHAAGPAPVGTSSKKPADSVKPAVAPPQLLPPVSPEAATIQPVSQTEAAAAGSGKKSEVMRQLELLYQQDGREMPELNTDIKPVPTGPGANASGSPAATSPGSPGTTAAPATAPAATGGHRMQQAAPTAKTPAAPATSPAAPAAHPAAKSKYPVVSFFKKLVPGSKDPKPTKAPAEYRPDVAPLPPVGIASQPPAQLQTDNSDRLITVDASSSSLPSLDNQPRAPFQSAEVPSALPQPLVEIAEIPPSPNGTLESPGSDEQFLPPLQADPRTVGTAKLNDIPAAPAGPAETSSPFSEMSEAEADKKMEMNPFTGLTLSEEAGSANPAANKTAAADSTLVPPPASAEDPFADELKKMGIVPPSAESPSTPAVLPTPKSSDTPTFDGIEDQATREKMKKIHERGSMKGLKGFCPVTLRDQRELVDAKPEFHSTFRGQKFHFADADAKLKFDEEPARYAPAAYGADVVALTRDKDVVEGTLDFAAWFKGRLYLFGTQEAHDTFVGDPSKYATPVGIE